MGTDWWILIWSAWLWSSGHVWGGQVSVERDGVLALSPCRCGCLQRARFGPSSKARAAALMILQRLLYLVVASMASSSIWKAMHSELVRAQMGGHVQGDTPAAGPGAGKCDVETGEAAAEAATS